MPTVLTVISPFGGRATGDRIDDPAEIREILAGDHAQHVVRSEAAETPADRKPKNRNQE